jgi:hypothetical protein
MEVIDVWARVARFAGGTPAGLDAEMASTKQHLANGSRGLPPGLDRVKHVIEAINREEGTGLSIVFCDSEEELRKADEALNGMSPSSEGSGRRVSVGLYEVVVDQELT